MLKKIGIVTFVILAVLFFFGKDFYRTCQVKRLVKGWELEKAKGLQLLVTTGGEKELLGDEVTAVSILEDQEMIRTLARYIEKLEWSYFGTDFKGYYFDTICTCHFGFDEKEEVKLSFYRHRLGPYVEIYRKDGTSLIFKTGNVGEELLEYLLQKSREEQEDKKGSGR